MFDLLDCGKHKSDASGRNPDPSIQPLTPNRTVQHHPDRDGAHGAARRAQAAWHYGHGIEGDVKPVHIHGQGDGVLLQLEVMHWHDALVSHAPALE